MYERADKRRLYWLIHMYLDGIINEAIFCNDFVPSYNVDLDHETLTEEEHTAFFELGNVVSRFSEFDEDVKKYPGTYFTKEEVKQKIAETAHKLGKYFKDFKDNHRVESSEICEADLPTIKACHCCQSQIVRIRELKNAAEKKTQLDPPGSAPERIRNAFQYVHAKAMRGASCSIGDILEIHRLLGGSGYLRRPTISFFDHNNIGVGTYQTPPNGAYLLALLEKYIRAYHPKLKALDTEEVLWQACMAYFIFELIHPFNDMNGRVGRLMCAWVLCLHGYECIASRLEIEWGDKEQHRSQFQSGFVSYLAFLENPDALNSFLNLRFFPYFLDQIEAMLERV